MIKILEDTWKPVHAGGQVVYNLEARQSGRPYGISTLTYLDNGLETWKPC